MVAAGDELVGGYKPLAKFAEGPPPALSCSQAILQANQVHATPSHPAHRPSIRGAASV